MRFKGLYLTLVAVAGLALAGVFGCAATQQAIDKSVAWLDKPASTQPNAPTHEQVITSTVQTTAPLLPSPVGEIAAAVTVGGLYVLRKLSKSDHGTTHDKVDAVADLVKKLADAVEPKTGPQQSQPPQPPQTLPVATGG